MRCNLRYQPCRRCRLPEQTLHRLLSLCCRHCHYLRSQQHWCRQHCHQMCPAHQTRKSTQPSLQCYRSYSRPHNSCHSRPPQHLPLQQRSRQSISTICLPIHRLVLQQSTPRSPPYNLHRSSMLPKRHHCLHNLPLPASHLTLQRLLLHFHLILLLLLLLHHPLSLHSRRHHTIQQPRRLLR